MFAQATRGDVVDIDPDHQFLHRQYCPPPTRRHYHTKFSSESEAQYVLDATLSVTPDQIVRLKDRFNIMAQAIGYADRIARIHEDDCDGLVDPAIQRNNQKAAENFTKVVRGQIKYMKEHEKPFFAE
jgi:uncharacterized Ntn-hydrolase superfamily protein